MIIYVYVITLYKDYYCIKKFEDFLSFLAFNDWFLLLREVEKDFFTPNKVVKKRHGVGEEKTIEVARHLLVYKHKFEFDYING